ncbi:MAG TPA: S-adenosylmethionine decarboxylase [Flavisolibacter sp.]|nr:S-adenosylmethionine decarboxylase [Flavisolibacter sp.]
MSYSPGTHLIATLLTSQIQLIESYIAFKERTDELIECYSLQKLGEVYHNFSPSGFTGVVCLSESHLSIHTWPEHGRVNIDIYLSNYLRENDGTVQGLYDAILNFLNASTASIQYLKR